MLISMQVENWMSFRDAATLSMVASAERQHGDRVPRVKRYRFRALPVAAIYGGNASGKTNLFKAAAFARRRIVKGTEPDAPIPVEPFILDAKHRSRPTRFEFDILVDETVYNYTFAVTRERVTEESLAKVLPSREHVLFRRRAPGGSRKGSFKLGAELEDDKFLHFAFEGTRDNQLYLKNCVDQKVDIFKPVYDWFRDSLVLIAPDSLYMGFQPGTPRFEELAGALSHLDTGIIGLGWKPVSADGMQGDLLRDSTPDEMNVRIGFGPGNLRLHLHRAGGKVQAKKLVAYHRDARGRRVEFETRQESDGTMRAIDLLPAFLRIAQPGSTATFLVDEMDRSLHTLLVRQLIESFLGTCSHDTRSQLVFTTHDAMLMDQSLLRRDEIWITEREESGSTSLLSLSEYKDVRYDKDIRKSYLQGRMGGVPHITYSGPCVGGPREKRKGRRR